MKAARTIQLAWRRYLVLKEEQIRRNVLAKVVLIGGEISAFQRSLLAETEAKADEKVILQGHKIRAWAAWSLLAGAKMKGAHEDLEESDAPDESTDDEVTPEEESDSEVSYEERAAA